MSAIDRFDCSLIDEPIETVISSDLDVVDEPKESLSDKIIFVGFSINSESHKLA